MRDNYKDQLKWEHYLIRHGADFYVFWEEMFREKERRVLFILGLGFDPRMCTGLRAILNAGGTGLRECLLIEFDEGPNSPSRAYSQLVDKNREILDKLMAGKGTVNSVSLPMWSEDGRRIGARRASESVDASTINGFTDIVVDISALPRGIYYPIITKLLYHLDDISENRPTCNLHVLIAENVSLDENIQEAGVDENATYLHGFSSDLEQEATAGIPVVWIPVLGEGKETQLIRIYDHIKPDEICPVLPSPSRNPRRADNLVFEYRELLFDRLRVEPQNIIFSCERNPFETYRQIYSAIRRYHKALRALGGCKVVLSAVSSKLLSIGALLAAYEAKRAGYKIGISYIESHGYVMNSNQVDGDSEELFCLWLAGECYHE